MNARIDSANDDTVKLDFNHAPSGKELLCDLTSVGLGEATAEKNEHGHAHADEHQHQAMRNNP